jgi:dihydroxyacetone kinase-like predicted kinase
MYMFDGRLFSTEEKAQDAVEDKVAKFVQAMLVACYEDTTIAVHATTKFTDYILQNHYKLTPYLGVKIEEV